jgi:[ribosomal protein S18]-alanine N-acetyltransferase
VEERDGYEPRRLTRERVREHLAVLMELDRDTLGEPWTEEHWLYEAPEKWELSRVIDAPDGTPVAFVVASRKPGAIHLNRMVVGPEMRGRGLATRLVQSLARIGLGDGTPNLSLKVHPTNASARRLFERLGFRVVGEDRNLHMMARCEDVPKQE